VQPLNRALSVPAVEPSLSLRPCVQGKDDRGSADRAEWHIPWTLRRLIRLGQERGALP
jgi:hypothetical protein